MFMVLQNTSEILLQQSKYKTNIRVTVADNFSVFFCLGLEHKMVLLSKVFSLND